MKKIFTLIAALVTTLTVSAATVGAEDNTSPFFSAFSESFTVNKGEKAVAKFVNHNPGTGNNWFNWVLIPTKAGAGVPVYNAEGNNYVWPGEFPEYGAVRSDNFGWGTYFDKPGDDPAAWAATYENNYDWTDFLGLMNGAEVEVTIQQTDEGNLSVEALTKKDGKTYNYKVVSKKALDAESFSFIFTVENSHLSDFTVSIEKPAVASNHTYDFTAWSAETVANLKAELADQSTGWSDCEKADQTEPTEFSKENCFWNAGDAVIEGEELKANGTVIAETKGLKFGGITEKRGMLAIAVNYAAHVGTNFGPYNGPAYLWLGNKADYFLIPDVPAGATIKMGVESHKNGATEGESSDPRGVQLSIDGTNLGNAFTPTLYAENEWTVPEGTGTVTVKVQATSGCHVYFIDIVGGTTGVDNVKAVPAKAQPKKVLTKDGIIIDGKYTISGALVR